MYRQPLMLFPALYRTNVALEEHPLVTEKVEVEVVRD